MTIHEPMTMATDYLLAVVSAWAAWKLFVESRDQHSRTFWALALAFLALGALLGGTWHGFVHSDALWKATVLSIGVTSFGMLVGSACATLGETEFGDRVRQATIGLATFKLILYVGWMLVDDHFIYVVLDTGTALLVVAALHLWRWNGPVFAGVVLSVIAALVQGSGFTLHEHFNHNDLYHVIQTVAVLLLYRGARQLHDQAKRFQIS